MQIFKQSSQRFAWLRFASGGSRTSAHYVRFGNRGSQSSSFQWVYNPVMRKYAAVGVGCAGLFYVTHLEQTPVSGRTRFVCIPRSLELRIGKYSYNSILRENQNALLPPSHPITLRVERVFYKILDAAYKDPSVDKSNLEGIKWQVHVVDDPRAPPNAFVLPGGKVFVFSSMLGISQNDDGLATVLSHEFAHQLARHTAENLSKAPVYFLLNILLYTVTGADTFNGLLLDGFLRMPASRQMETEADYIGLMIMSRACFQPAESIKLWQRMSEFERKRGGGPNLEFLSTHPASNRRIENMAKWMPRAKEIYDQADCSVMNRYYNNFQSTLFGGSAPSSFNY